MKRASRINAQHRASQFCWRVADAEPTARRLNVEQLIDRRRAQVGIEQQDAAFAAPRQCPCETGGNRAFAFAGVGAGDDYRFDLAPRCQRRQAHGQRAVTFGSQRIAAGNRRDMRRNHQVLHGDNLARLFKERRGDAGTRGRGERRFDRQHGRLCRSARAGSFIQSEELIEVR